jgi:iron complex outermembrane receptor protein
MGWPLLSPALCTVVQRVLLRALAVGGGVAIIALATAGRAQAQAQSPDAGASAPETDGGVRGATAPDGAPVQPEAIPSPADGGAAPPPPATGEMLVTAQRYEEDVQKAPVTVTPISIRAMEQRGVVNLGDVTKFVPNLELHSTNRPAGGGSAYAAYIRGIGTGDFQFPTDPGVGLYVDDVYIARTVGGLLSTDADIERIEVIKGPQGTLFGRNTIGGAFNVVTSKPLLTGPPTGSALVRYGDYGRRDLVGNVNAPLVDGIVGGKVTVAMLHSDGYSHQLLTGDRLDTEGRFVVRAGLRFKPNSQLEVRLDGDYSKQDQRPPAGVLLVFAPGGPTAAKVANFNQFAAPAYNQGLGLPKDSIYDGRWVSPGPHDNYSLQPMYDRYDIGGVAARITYSPTDWLSIKSISAFRVVSASVAVDGDQTPYSLQSTQTALDEQQYSEELQFAGDVLENRLKYLVGLYAFQETGTSSVNTQSFHGLFENEPMPNNSDAGDTQQRFGLTATSLAAFSQETFEVLRGLHLTAGARINHDQKDYNYAVDFTQTGAVQVPYSTAQASWNSFTPKVGADWSPFEPMMLFASYSEGFKSGGFGPSNLASDPTPKYDPEKVRAYEVGIKTQWFENRRLMVNAAAFYNDYRNIQLTVQSRDPVTGANVRTTENAGSSGIKGFEAELGAAPVAGLLLNGGVGYVDARFDTLTPQAIATGFKVGDMLPQVPDWSINGGAQYTLVTGAGEITLRGDVTYKGRQYMTAADPTSYQSPYALYSARLSFVPKPVDQLELSLYGINLSDKVYYIYLATLPPTGEKIGIAGAPRLIFATATYTF